MLEPGTIVGDKYRLEEPIGQGGMATVWRAVHTTLDRPVAVKFLEAVGTQAQKLAERFLQEAKLAAGLRHRHVVDIQDFGVTETGQPYMVMELLEGSSLADRYEEGPPVSDWDAMEIAAMTLSGLAAVHDQGILHRDVKPENIFLVEDADGMYPKLLDFGVSKGFDSDRRITRTGAVVGTPDYMSPEQARGVRDIGPRSDIFSMGIVLYEAFTGVTPFESENPGDVLINVATAEPVSLAELRPDLPVELVALVHKSLAKDPDHRFVDARAMREAIHDILSVADLQGKPGDVSYKKPAHSGLIRVLSSPPPAMVRPGSPPAKIAIPLTRKAPEISPPQKVPEDAEDLVTDTLPDVRRVRPPPLGKRERPGWAVPLAVVLGLALGLGVFVALGGPDRLRNAGWLPGGEDDRGTTGELLPGQDVAALTEQPPVLDEPAERPPLVLEPPPTDGVPAPESETIDVPSPPDPPDEVDEIEIEIDE